MASCQKFPGTELLFLLQREIGSRQVYKGYSGLTLPLAPCLVLTLQPPVSLESEQIVSGGLIQGPCLYQNLYQPPTDGHGAKPPSSPLNTMKTSQCTIFFGTRSRQRQEYSSKVLIPRQPEQVQLCQGEVCFALVSCSEWRDFSNVS